MGDGLNIPADGKKSHLFLREDQPLIDFDVSDERTNVLARFGSRGMSGGYAYFPTKSGPTMETMYQTLDRHTLGFPMPNR